MAWYKTGTVAVTNGSTTVTGSGTNWIAGANVGEGFQGPDGEIYEITAIGSATSLTLAAGYGGSTASGVTYAIVPTHALTANLASSVADLISDYQSVVDNAGAGKFGDGSAAAPAITFTLDQDTGFFRDTANEIAISVAGTKRGEFTASGLDLFGQIRGDTGQFDGNVNIDGTVTADGLTVDGGDVIASTGGMFITIDSDNNASGNSLIITHDGQAKSIAKFDEGGDISFYEDTGTTAKFVWDASAERLGIGTSSPSSPLDVEATTTAAVLTVDKTTTDTNAVGTILQLNTKTSGTAAAGLGSKINFVTENSNGTIYETAYISAFTNDSASAQKDGILSFSTADGVNNPAERMRITSSGKVGIGTSDPYSQLSVYGDTDAAVEQLLTIVNDGTGVGTGARIWLSGANATSRGTYIEAATKDSGNSHDLVFATNTAGAAPVEAMRIDSNGNLLLGSTSTTANDGGITTRVRGSASGSTSYIQFRRGASTNAAGTVLAFFHDGTLVGSVTHTNTSTTYSTSSDYRLKTDAQPMTGASARVQALNPVNFEWIADGTRVDGFLAHEAQEVVPEAVTGTKDAVDADGNPEYQGIDQSKLVPLLTAALQEALTEISDLKARVTALEG